MKFIKQILVAGVLIILASSCLKENTYSFNPTGDAYIELTKSNSGSDSILQYRLSSNAIDPTYGQAIHPATMTDALGTLYTLDNYAYGNGAPAYFGNFIDYRMPDVMQLDGDYNFTLTRSSDGLVANSVDNIAAADIPASDVPIVAIDSLTEDNSQGIGVLKLSWHNITGIDYYTVEIYSTATLTGNALIYAKSGKAVADSTTTSFSLPNDGTSVSLQSGNTYITKLYGVKLKSPNNVAYKTSDQQMILWK